MDKMQSLLSKQHKNLITDILKIAQEKVKKRGRSLTDLRFAKRTTNGYAFFEVGHEVWDMLHEITTEVFKKNPGYELSFVVELCSEVVNAEKDDLASLDLAL